MLDVRRLALPRERRPPPRADRPAHDFARALLAPRVPRPARRPRLRRPGAQPAAQQARTAHLHPRDRHAAAPPRHARPRRHPRTRRGADRRRRQGHRRRGQHRSSSPSCCCSSCTAPSKPASSSPDDRPPARVAAHRRGPQRAHPVGRQDARRRPLRRTRGRLRVAVLRADPRRGHPLRRALAAAVDLDLPHARDGRRPLARRPGDGGLLRPHLHRPRRAGTTALLPRRHRPAPHPPRASTSGSPTASRAPGSSPTRSRWRSSTTQRPRRPPPRRPARARRPPPRPRSPTRCSTYASRPTTASRGAERTARPARASATAAPSRGRRTARQPRRRPAAAARRRRDRRTAMTSSSDARRRAELPRRAPLRRRRDRSTTAATDRALRGPAARRRDRPRRLALQVPHRAAAARAVVARTLRPGRPAPPAQALRRRLPRALPTDRPPRLVPLDLPPRRTRATACSSTHGAHRPPRSATARARSTTTATSSTSSSSTPGCSPTAAPLGDRAARLGRRDRHRPAARSPRRHSCASTTTGPPKASATHAHACSAPTPCSRSTRDGERRRRTVPHRVRPHPPRRQELRQVPPLRRLPELVVAPHAARRPRRPAVRALRLPGRRPARAVHRRPPTTSSPATAGTPALRPEHHEYVGRRRILFALERDAHAGVLEAWRLPAFPPATPPARLRYGEWP